MESVDPDTWSLSWRGAWQQLRRRVHPPKKANTQVLRCCTSGENGSQAAFVWLPKHWSDAAVRMAAGQGA